MTKKIFLWGVIRKLRRHPRVIVLPRDYDLRKAIFEIHEAISYAISRRIGREVRITEDKWGIYRVAEK
jgi:hypothetical protein